MKHQPCCAERPFPPVPRVTRECEAVAVIGAGHSLPVSVAFHYAVEDPYAVRMVVETGMAEPVEWLFARDLLIEGVDRPAGLADVQVWPVPGRPDRLEAGHGSVRILISSSAGRATLTVPATVLREFLDRTTEDVEIGSESRLLCLDEGLPRLLARDTP